jgi:hypothetical protein
MQNNGFIKKRVISEGQYSAIAEWRGPKHCFKEDGSTATVVKNLRKAETFRLKL